LIGIGIILLIVFIKRRKKRDSKQKSENNSLTQQPSENTPPETTATIAKEDTPYKPMQKVFQSEPVKESKSSSNIELSNKHQIPFEDIEIGNELGRGSYGRVCLGRWSGTSVALKFCKEKGGLDEFWKEVKLMTYTISQ
jgi:hypothetical protein